MKHSLHLGYSWEILLFMLAHTAYFAILLSVIMWLRGSPRYLSSGSMRRFSTRLSVEDLNASANKEISFDLSL